MEDRDQDPERVLALSYAPPPARTALAALLGLDDALAAVLRGAREPAVAQIRLAWWRERLAALDSGPPPAMPVLEEVAATVLPLGVAGAELVPIVEGWEVLVEAEALDDEAIGRHGSLRGGTLFAIGGRLLGAPVSPGPGEGWALADLSRHLASAREADRAAMRARAALERGIRWPAALRALGALATIARMNLGLPPGAPVPVGAPRRVGRLAWLRLTGR